MDDKLDLYVGTYTGNNLYDFDNRIVLNFYSKRIIKLENSNQSVLELGLGHGFTAVNFSNYFKKYSVLEGSGEVIKSFKASHPNLNVEIVQTYFEKFDTDEKFDIIIMGFILEHVDSPIDLINHFKKFLSPTGKMFIVVPNAEVMNRRLGKLAGMLSHIQELSEFDVLSGHQRYYTLESLKRDITLAGLELILIEGLYLKPFTTKQMLSLNLDESIIDSLCALGVNYPELSCSILAQVKVK